MADEPRALAVVVPDGHKLIGAVFFMQDQESLALDVDFRMIDDFAPEANDKAQFVLSLRGLADAIELDLEIDEGLYPR